MRLTKLIWNLLCLCLVIACADDGANNLQVGGGQGQGGSLTRFAINGSYLYIASQTTLSVYDISSNEDFEMLKTVNVGFGLETISARGTYLYLGAQDAMYIYSISNPEDPQFIFRYSHIVSCDPVVVEGNRAYVTLSSGNFCNRGTNALEIIDISNPNNPVLIANYPMNTPLGIGIKDNILFVCEQTFGFTVFDVTNANDIQMLHHVNDIHAFDVILHNGVATITGDDGIYQYGYINSLELLSIIPVTK
ncbi:hypothetical protein SanaruYs_02110 [Chryseotalea sanaruensis]|uniref:LVIVD repeat-containing protein n=1 Tax=Chryseotalea sanaruensis TaxID=2482724 RepID=A0A401U5D5_9BACT|nr:hypothetical protein [Chryseotalea sanaruensis]GCC49996.1 hypothetical protein SanaruYs_02110 [Chryseotalea sanaruensis]